MDNLPGGLSMNHLSHPMHKCDHEENRVKVCAPCGKKIIIKNRDRLISEFLISPNLSALIKQHVNERFDTSNSKFPLSICGSCRISICKLEKANDDKRSFPTMPNYEDMNLAKETTRMKMQCNCYICLTARSQVHFKATKGRGRKRTFSPMINQNNGLDGAMPNLQLQVCKKKKSDVNSSIELCTSCLQEIGKGIYHSCAGPSSSTARDNALNVVQKLPEKQQNQIIATLLKKRQDNEDKRGDIHLNTSGSKLRVTLNKKKDAQVKFTTEGLDAFQTTTGMSRNNMNKLTNLIRIFAGRRSVPKEYKQHMQERSSLMEEVYKVESSYEFETPKEGTIKRPIIYANASEILSLIYENRKINMNDKTKIKLMADGGQGFFKMSIIVLTEEECESDEHEIKRASYSAGGSMMKKQNSNSVYRLILLCIVPKITESYANMKILFELTKINEIPYKFSSDFKLIITVNGQQTASATYPCPYCYITLTELQGTQQLNEVESPMEVDNDDNGIILKTYKNIKEDYSRFQDFRNNKKYAKECHSTVNHPLLVQEEDDEDDDMYVIEKCVLPELHLLQGFTNHLFWNGLVPTVGRENALVWPKKLKLVAKNYQGDIFEGNACRQLLKNSDKLNDPQVYKDVGIFRLQPYIATFKAMNKIVESCFSTQRPDVSELDKNLIELKKAFESTGVSKTLKIHVILDHLKQGLLYLNNDGLGLWSEQAGESVHREFVKYWERFKINTIDDPSFATRLKKAVVTFSSQHL